MSDEAISRPDFQARRICEKLMNSVCKSGDNEWALAAFHWLHCIRNYKKNLLTRRSKEWHNCSIEKYRQGSSSFEPFNISLVRVDYLCCCHVRPDRQRYAPHQRPRKFCRRQP